jgi:hypothetical protein
MESEEKSEYRTETGKRKKPEATVAGYKETPIGEEINSGLPEFEISKVRGVIDRQRKFLQNGQHKIADVGEKAREQLELFEQTKSEYEKKWMEMFGHEKPAERESLVDKATVNVRRWFTDMKERKGRRVDLEAIRTSEVELVVEGRDAVIGDFEAGRLTGENAPIYEKLVAKELAAEANANHFLMVRGLKREELHFVIEQMGQNPIAFLSDPRGENAGRIAIDNALVDGEQPLGINTEEEKRYWSPVFPNPPRWVPEGIKKWMMSRTHGVIYGVRDTRGDEEFLIPIHVDPKNGVAAIGEIFTGRRKGERAALDYHQGVDMGDQHYLGTGLYDLGAAVMIELMERAQEKGVIGKLIVRGAEKLDTTGSIYEDDKLTWEKERQYRVGKGLKQHQIK